MTGVFQISTRLRSVLPIGLFFAYVLSFIFEGPAFYSMAAYYGVDPTALVWLAVSGECLGLVTGGLIVRDGTMAQRLMLGGMAVCFGFTGVFFFAPSQWWMVAMVLCALTSGMVNSAWGFFLRIYTQPGERLKSCADVLILSNVLMILINLITIHVSPFAGLGAALALIAVAMVATALLPPQNRLAQSRYLIEQPMVSVRGPLTMLVVFVTVITINSGLMYQSIVPSYDHLAWLTSWYWAVPYIVALLVMRNLHAGGSRSLYIGMAMIMASFIFFVALGRGPGSYVVVDTLMLGACGIFDLFWWSILAQMLDRSDHPSRIFGIGLAANVFGILLGKLLAWAMSALNLHGSSVTIVALTVAGACLMMLPALNLGLSNLLKTHFYLTTFAALPTTEQHVRVRHAPTITPLTPREQDVLMRALNGSPTRVIATDLCVSENTVKTHLRHIYEKYQVNSRSELFSVMLGQRSSSE